MRHTLSLLLASVCILMAYKPPAGAQSTTQLKIEVKEAYRYNAYTLGEISYKATAALLKGKLPAFQDAGCSMRMDTAQVSAMFRVCEPVVTFPDPNDLFRMEEEIVCYMTEPSVNHSLAFAANVKQMCVGFSVLNEIGDTFYIYTPQQSLLKILHENEKSVILQLRAEAQAERIILDNIALITLSDSIFRHIVEPMYEASIQGRLKAYANDSLKRTRSREEIQELRQQTEYMIIPNDTGEFEERLVAYQHYLSGIILTDEWYADAKGMQIRPRAIGPAIEPLLHMQVYFMMPLCMAKYGDAMATYTKEQQKYMEGFFQFARMRQLHPSKYSVVEETELQAEEEGN